MKNYVKLYLIKIMYESRLFLEQVKKTNLDDYLVDIEHIKRLQIDQEKWNIGKNDIYIFIKSEQVYFYLIKKITETGKLETIGSISVFHDGRFAMVGSFIIDATLRSQGIGQYVFSKVLSLHQITLGGLLSEHGRENFYERNAFHIEGSFSKISIEVKKNNNIDMILDKITPSEIKKLANFDKKCTGLDRQHLLQSMIEEPENVTYILFNDNSVSGYGILRPLQQGYRISIYALSNSDFEEILGKIMKHLLTCSQLGQIIPVILDCPTAKEEILLASQGFLLQARYALMFKNTSSELPPRLSSEYTWGLLTEECG